MFYTNELVLYLEWTKTRMLAENTDFHGVEAEQYNHIYRDLLSHLEACYAFTGAFIENCNGKDGQI